MAQPCAHIRSRLCIFDGLSSNLSGFFLSLDTHNLFNQVIVNTIVIIKAIFFDNHTRNAPERQEWPGSGLLKMMQVGVVHLN